MSNLKSKSKGFGAINTSEVDVFLYEAHDIIKIIIRIHLTTETS